MSDVVIVNPFMELVDDEGSSISTVSGVDGIRLLTSSKLRSPDNTVDLGDLSNPVRIDPTGDTTQPISAASLPLPDGAATETTLSSFKTSFDNRDLATELTVSGINSTVNSIDTRGQDSMSNSLPVVIANDQSDIDIVAKDINGQQVHIPIGNTVSGVDQHGVVFFGRSELDKAEVPTVARDQQDGKFRLSIEGKVTTSLPSPPQDATQVTIAADDPLEVQGSEDTEYIIPNGTTFHIQQVIAGAQGDPNETGSKIEIIYNDGVENLIERLYVVGFTEFGNYPDTSTTRNGKKLEGNGTNKIVIRRDRIGGNALEVDAVVRGYYQ